MRKQRSYSAEFKRQIVEELLSGVSTAAQLSRRHQISPGLLYHWRRQYAKGAYENEPTKEAALEERVRQLEQMLGKVVLENEFLKKAVKKSLEEARKKESSLPTIGTISKASRGGANL